MNNKFKQIEGKEELVEALKNDNVYVKFKRKEEPDKYKKSEHSGKTTFNIWDGPDLYNMFKLGQYYKKVEEQEETYSVIDRFEHINYDKVFQLILIRDFGAEVNLVQMTNVSAGRPYCGILKHVDDIYSITQEEFDKLVGGKSNKFKKCNFRFKKIEEE